MRYLLLAFTLAAPLAAQQPTTPPTPQAPRAPKPTTQVNLRPAVADTGIFAPIDLPQGNDIRRMNGAPGPKYWQQRADYSIKAILDTAAKKLSGTMTIRYTNNSPDTLTRVWMQLDQNLFKPGSVGSLLNAEESRFGGGGFQGGFEIPWIVQSQTGMRAAKPLKAPTTVGLTQKLRTRVDDTMMEVYLTTPLAPGKTTQFDLQYTFNIPDHGADRMGRDGTLYELAQWYPRMAVYDDVHGWNTLQYLGQGEFYLEYGDIDYEVTVPAGYIVAGTGTLQNPLEVLTAAQRSRLAAAARSDSITHIVTADELTSGAARPSNSATLTWKFKATKVRDAAWAASPEYLWDVSSWKGIVANAYYRPSAIETWKDAADMSRYSIMEYSTRWFNYPYPQISAVEGPVSGMEYPMVAMEARGESKEDLYSVVTHEIGHMWYPMTVGSDERRYAWMDEGFNTFINTFSEEGYFKRDDATRRRGETAYVLQNDQAITSQPIMTYANRYRTGSNLGSLAYVKPSIGLLTLRNKILGPEVFDSAFREYTKRWAFKHPQPADFFRTVEDVSGRDLDWFWRGWFFTTAALDQSVESVTQSSGGVAKIVIRNLGQQVMPVELQVTLADGTSKLLEFPVEIWYASDKYVVEFPTDQTITAATVNPDGQFPDINPANDGWKQAPTP
jgi:peptidase M1-like protein